MCTVLKNYKANASVKGKTDIASTPENPCSPVPIHNAFFPQGKIIVILMFRKIISLPLKILVNACLFPCLERKCLVSPACKPSENGVCSLVHLAPLPDTVLLKFIRIVYHVTVVCSLSLLISVPFHTMIYLFSRWTFNLGCFYCLDI